MNRSDTGTCGIGLVWDSDQTLMSLTLMVMTHPLGSLGEDERSLCGSRFFLIPIHERRKGEWAGIAGRRLRAEGSG